MATRERGDRWRGGRSRRMEEGEGGGESSRPASFRASVSGLVRRVSQKVSRENKGQSVGHQEVKCLLIDYIHFRKKNNL